MSADTTSPGSNAPAPPRESVKETLVSVIIAFVLAFVFRGFVIEAFVIPTGSMAPTLLGQHMRFIGQRTGTEWTVNPRDSAALADGQMSPDPLPVQGRVGQFPAVPAVDPSSGEPIGPRQGVNIPTRAGDRILVLKYLYALREPQRLDVVVFKNPEDPGVNYIKRLLGLPNQLVAIVDGDIFFRPLPPDDNGPYGARPSTWNEPGWRIARAEDATARATWQRVFDSALVPRPATAEPGSSFRVLPPFEGATTDWQLVDAAGHALPVYRYAGQAPTALVYNDRSTERMPDGTTRPRPIAQAFTLTDYTPFNQLVVMPARPPFPVSDIAVRAAVEFSPTGTPGAARRVAVLLKARGHEFRATVDSAGSVKLQMRPDPATLPPGSPPAWNDLASGSVEPTVLLMPAEIEFWHLDQRLSLFIGGRLVARADYDWSPAQRVKHATGRDLETLTSADTLVSQQLSKPELYRKPQLRLEFDGGPLTLHRVVVSRGLHYRSDERIVAAREPGQRATAEPSWATHPLTTMALGPDQFFCCGDNSAMSHDGRMWGPPHPWVRAKIDSTPGIVPRDLMLGKAFFVYFPAWDNNPVFMPGFGHMRFIR